MENIVKNFSVNCRGFGRVYGGHEKLMDNADLQAWNSASENLSNYVYKIDDEYISIAFDWKPAIDHLKLWSNIHSLLLEKKTDVADNLIGDNLFKPIIFDASISIPINWNDEKNSLKNSLRYLEHYLNTFFLILNLSSPGCCSLDFTTIYSKDDEETSELNLSPFIFEEAWHQSLNNGWPKVEYQSLLIVKKWIEHIGIRNQLAQNKIEKALFCILHLVRENKPNPTSLLWLAHALEALFDLGAGAPYSILINRIYEFLNLPVDKKSWFNKRIRRFYAKRHSFVHGNMDIFNPVQISTGYSLGTELEYANLILEEVSFGSCILVACLQEFIKRSWKDIKFKENQYGIVI